MIDNPLYLKDLDTTIAHIIGKEKLEGASFLITGSTGTIGSFLTDVLLRMNDRNGAGIKVYAAGRDLIRTKTLFGDREDLIFLQYDLNSEIDFDVSADYIIHLAGNSHPAAFNSDPTGTLTGSINSTWRLLEYGRKHGAKRLLFLSSGEVYSDMDTLTPRAAYPMSKRAGETLCVSYTAQYGLETVIARCCHTFGPFVTGSDNRAHVQFMKYAINGRDIVMHSKGLQLRSYLYVADCASALLTVLACGNTGASYDIASESNKCTIAELANMIGEIRGCRVLYEEPDDKRKRDLSPILDQVLDGHGLADLGWISSDSIYNGLNNCMKIMGLKDV